MSLSITSTETEITDTANKTRSVFDRYDNIVSIVNYDDNNKVSYIIKSKNNPAGNVIEKKILRQVQVDIPLDIPAIDITESSARLRGRVYTNDNSIVYETGFVYWLGEETDDFVSKTHSGNVFFTPNVFKGGFSKVITNLKDNAVYYYRAYVKHEYGINYSETKQFLTVDKTTIFAIDGDRFSGPSPLTVNLTAINAGFGNYTYAWNTTGGSIGFEYPLNSISITFSGEGYTPQATNYTLTGIEMILSGYGYNADSYLNVLVNDVHIPSLTANKGFNNESLSYGVTSVSIPLDFVNGFKTSLLNITFSSSNGSTIMQSACGIGDTVSYEIDRENVVLVDGTIQPSLSVITYLNPENGLYAVSAIKFLQGPLVYSNSSRTLVLSSNGPVDVPAVISPNTSITITNADYVSNTITHTYSGKGNVFPKVYAIQGDQIIKEATKIIRISNISNFAPEWQSVLTSPFANNIAAAYDLRNIAGQPSLSENLLYTYNFKEENTIGGYFKTLPSFKSPLPHFGLNGDSVGGYAPIMYLAGYAPQAVGGYNIAGYDINKIFGPGITEDDRSIRFEYNVGGYRSLIIGGYVEYKSYYTGMYINTYAFSDSRPFSVSLWVNPTEFKEPGTRIFSIQPWGAYRGYEFTVNQSTSSLSIFENIYLSEVIAGYTTQEPIAGYFTGYPMLYTEDASKMLTQGEWNHIVITRDEKKGYKFYKNGELALSSVDTGWGIGGYDNYGGQYGFGGVGLTKPAWGPGGYAASIFLGNTVQFNSTVAPFSGLMDKFAIWRKELSDTEVIDLYSGGLGTDDYGYYNPIIGPKLWIGGMGRYYGTIDTVMETEGDTFYDNVSLLLNFDGLDGSYDFEDTSLNLIELSSTGATITSATKLFGTGAGKFTTLGGYITTLSGEDYGAFGTGSFTIEWWEYIAGYGANNYNPVIFYGNPGIDNIDNYNVMLPEWGITRAAGGYGPGTELRFYMGNTTLNNNKYITFQDNINTAGGGFLLSSWSYNVIQRDVGGYNSSMSYYKNGALAGYFPNIPIVDIGTNIQSPFSPGTGIIGGAIIGGYSNYDGTSGTWEFLDGYINGLRITKGVARYSSNFTIPTSAFPTEKGDIIGTKFKPTSFREGSFAVATESIPFTTPYTIAFIGKADVTRIDRTVFQNLQSTYSYYSNINLNGFDQGTVNSRGDLIGFRTNFTYGPNNLIPYYPVGDEWFYISYSFLGPDYNDEVRYYLQTPTVSSEGLIAGYGITDFQGIPGFGIGGYALGSYYSSNYSIQRPINTIDGVGRLGIYINEGFPSHSGMQSLYSALTAGPANNIKLQ